MNRHCSLHFFLNMYEEFFQQDYNCYEIQMYSGFAFVKSVQGSPYLTVLNKLFKWTKVFL